MTDIDIARWEEYLEHRTGVFLSARSAHVKGAVVRRIVASGAANEDDYWELMQGPGAALEWSLLVDELVVKDTRFFRHRASFEFLREHINGRLADGTMAPLYSLWSVGCSSGEEAWSLAMVANDCFNLAVEHDGYFAVQGTDVSMQAISQSREGDYGQQQVGQLTTGERARYLEVVERRYRIGPELRRRVAFNVGNIIEMSRDGLKYDVLFCQNLLVYFRKWRRRRVLDLMVSRMNVDGLLIIGPGEMTQWQHPKLRFVGKGDVVAYQKIIE